MPLEDSNATDGNDNTIVVLADKTDPTKRAAVDANGNVLTNLHNSSGTEVGTASAPLRTDPTGTTTQPVSASSLPLPTGASTSSLQTTGNTSLASIDAGIPNALGAATIANSMPINIASDQVVPVSATALPLPTGAATSANQSTEITALNTIDSDIKNTQGPVTPGTSATKSELAGAVYNSSAPTLTAGQQAALQSNSSGALKVDGSAVTQPISGSVSVSNFPATQNVAITSSVEVEIKNDTGNPIPVNGTVTANQGTSPWAVSAASLPLPTGASTEATLAKLPLAQASTTSGEFGVLSQGAVTTAAPTYITGQTNPLSLTPAGALRTDSSATTQPISGAITANIGTTNGLALDTSVNSLLKPASTLAAVTTVGSITNTVVVKADTALNQTNAFKVDGSGVTQPVSGAVTATISGTPNVAVTSSVLPTGAATATNQTTANTSLNSIDTKTPALGQALAAASVPIVLTAAQLSTLTPLSSVSISNFPATQPVSATSLPLPTGAATSALQTIGNNSLASIDAGIPAALGAATIVNSMPVNIASDQVVPVSATSLPLPTGAATTALQTAGNASVASIDVKTPSQGQKIMAASLPVTIASDQSSIPVAVIDGAKSGGTQGVLTLTTANTTYELKVGASRLALRKVVTGLPVMANVYWGYTNAVTTSTGTLMFKNQFGQWALNPSDPNAAIWIVCATAGATVQVTESP